MILNDRQISDLCKPDRPNPLIHPFIPKQVKEGCISYGLSSFGYDIRCSSQFKIFTNLRSAKADPKAFDLNAFVDFEGEGEACTIPPNSFVLTHSLEYIRMPRDCLALVIGKSTYARVGISCLGTPLEPGWEGHVTLEFANTTPVPAVLYANEGCCQLVFYRGEPPIVSYADRQGKYQGQEGIVTARL